MQLNINIPDELVGAAYSSYAASDQGSLELAITRQVAASVAAAAARQAQIAAAEAFGFETVEGVGRNSKQRVMMLRSRQVE